MSARGWFRAGLFLLALTNGVTGAWAAVASQSFFDNFPLPGHPWVALLPPYNGHLAFDVGVLFLASAATLAVAAVALEPLLVRTALVSYLIFALPHFVFHVTHLQGFPVGDAVAQTVVTALVVVLALVLLGVSGRLSRPGTAGRESPARRPDPAARAGGQPSTDG